MRLEVTEAQARLLVRAVRLLADSMEQVAEKTGDPLAYAARREAAAMLDYVESVLDRALRGGSGQ
jgi:hypothetical protein